MQKIIDFLYKFFGLIFFFSFFLTVISAIFIKKAYMYGTVINVPAVFFVLCFFSLFFIFTFKPSWGNKTTVTGWKKYLVSIFILAITVIGGYIGIYLPLSSNLVFDLNNVYINIDQPIIGTFDANKSYFIETELVYKESGTQIEIIFKNDYWQKSFLYTAGIKDINQDLVYGNQTDFLTFKFPEDGVYEIFIKTTTDKNTINSIRLFQRK